MDKELLKLCYKDFLSKKDKYNKMYEYYKGNTDAMNKYKMVTSRSNTKINTNFFKKFVKEEVSYSIGNDINYITSDGDNDILKDIRYYTSHIRADHDIDLFKDMLIYSFAYELYFFDDEGNFNMTVLTPNEAYAYEDEVGNVKLFMHIFKENFKDDITIKVYTDKDIIYYTKEFKELKREFHKFNSVPVGIARVSDEHEDDSIYKDIKGLQDAYEINLSDISNEISDFRNAYLKFRGAQLDENDLKDMKKLGAMQFGSSEGDAEWLIKNINDSFIQNTLTTIEEKMYQISNHINYNEKMQSNSSSLALKARLISLEAKCRLNEKAFSNCVQKRIKFLFEYISFIKNKEYRGDYRKVFIKFTPNIPSDDLIQAQIIQLLGDTISKKTALSLLSFIENPDSEINRKEKEEQEEFEYNYLEKEDDVIE